jgi:predicted O-methyltransferase YrrM
MTSTRVTTLVVFFVGSAGLALASIAASTPVAVAGAALVMAAAIYLVRHFWRESDRKRKQELVAQSRAIAKMHTELRDTTDQVRTLVHTDLQDLPSRIDTFARGVLEYVAQVQLDLEDANEQMRLAERRASKHRDQVLSQVSGVIGVYATLKPEIPYPPFGGWAITGDCARRLVELILTDRPSSVIEIGSGLSTLLVAQALEVCGAGGHILALEHEKTYLDRSVALLAQHGVSHRAQVIHAPLIETDIRGEIFRWYDLSSCRLPDQVDLIFIDGPPKATGSLARYPALPLLIDRLGPRGVVLMDDANRPDERSAVKRWQEEYTGLEVAYHKDSNGTFEIRRSSA